MDISGFLKSLFSPFLSVRRQSTENGRPRETDGASFSAHKLGIDLRFRDFTVSLTRSKLKGILKRPSYSAVSPPPDDPASKDAPHAGETDITPVYTAPAFGFLLEHVGRLFEKLRDVYTRIEALEKRISRISSMPAEFVWLKPDPGVLAASTPGVGETAVLSQALAFTGDSVKSYEWAETESPTPVRGFHVVA